MSERQTEAVQRVCVCVCVCVWLRVCDEDEHWDHQTRCPNELRGHTDDLSVASGEIVHGCEMRVGVGVMSGRHYQSHLKGDSYFL